MDFTTEVKDKILVECGRHCPICHRFRGTALEVYPIRPFNNGGTDTSDNAIALCSDCYEDMVSYDDYNQKGTKYSEAELREHKNNWAKKVTASQGPLHDDKFKDVDRQVYRTLREILPWDGGIDFIKDKPFLKGPFGVHNLNPLHAFISKCQNPDFQFADSDLEGLRAQLLEQVDHFLYTIAHETFLFAEYKDHNNPMNHIPPEWESEQPDRSKRVTEDLNKSSDEICNTYTDIIQLATRKLGIIPEKM